MTVRVVVVDDQELVRSGFSMILDAQDDLDVVGEAADGVEAVALVGRVRPDVVLMDIRMPRLDGIAATEQILGQAAGEGYTVKVVILTTFDIDEYVFQALRAGASGFLLKDLRREDLVHAVRVAAVGDALLAPSITRRLIEDFVNRPAAVPDDGPRIEDLTPREQEVLVLIGRGLNNHEIGERLIVSEATVKTHVGHVLMKLDLRDRVHAVIYAYEMGLVG